MGFPNYASCVVHKRTQPNIYILCFDEVNKPVCVCHAYNTPSGMAGKSCG